MSRVEERYARAVRSSHLEVEDKPGDIDQIIAAGLAESLGTMLTRLRSEWDTATGKVEQYRRARAEWARLASDAADRAQSCMSDAEKAKRELSAAPECDKAALRSTIEAKSIEAKRQESESARFHREATREQVTERWEILSGLRTLEPVKQALFGFACVQAPRRGCESDATAIGALVGRVIDVWLDKLCHHCDGRGFNGGYGTPRLECRPCRGTGSRRMGQLSESPSEHQFGLWLLNVMDSKCNGALGQISRKTRNA